MGHPRFAPMNVHKNPKPPRVSTQRKEKLTEAVRVEYFFSFAISAEFTSQLAPPEEVAFEGARVSEQVKSKMRGKPLHLGMKDVPSGLFSSSRHIPTGSKTAGTPPDTKAQQSFHLMQHVRECGLHYTYKTNHEIYIHQHYYHKHKYARLLNY